jgi:hypothetical protein
MGGSYNGSSNSFIQYYSHSSTDYFSFYFLIFEKERIFAFKIKLLSNNFGHRKYVELLIC